MVVLALLCDRCEKPSSLCVCQSITPVETKTEIIILQHPQEPDKTLGTARLAHCCLPNSQIKIGLSWRNLSAAVGRHVDPKKWLVLYLGSAELPKQKIEEGAALFFVDPKGALLAYQEIGSVEGLVVLDGTWSQAKTLWWRNAWLLKLRRCVLKASAPSKYGKLRKEPRRESISTIESLAYALDILEKSKCPSHTLIDTFEKLLRAFKTHGSSMRDVSSPTMSDPKNSSKES